MMGDMIYKWRDGSRYKIKPEVAGEELERIRTANGGKLVQAQVVDAARSNNSPLHSAFEWDNAKAAHAFRLDQAGQLIRSLVVIVEQEHEEKSPPLRAFVNVTQDSERSYTSLAHAMSDEDMRRQLIEQAWNELKSWKQRYGEIKEFAKLVTVIDAMNVVPQRTAA